MPFLTAIDATDADLKFALASWDKKRGLQLERVFTVDFSDLGKDEAAMGQRTARLREKLKSAQDRLPAGESALLVPKQNCIARRVRLPTNEPEELRQMARFEGEKLIPFNVERHIISHTVLKAHGIEGTDVLIAAIDEPVMSRFLSVVSAAGIEPAFAEVSSVALSESFLGMNPPEASDSPVVLLHIGTVHCDITILHKGMLVTTRSILNGMLSLVQELNGEVTPALAEPVKLERQAMIPASDSRISVPMVLKMDLNEPAPVSLDDPALADQPPTRQNMTIRAWIMKLVTNVRRTYEFALREAQLPPIGRIYLTGEGASMTGMTEALRVNLGVEVEVFNPLAAIPRAPGLGVDEATLLTYAPLHAALLRLQTEMETASGSAPTRTNLLPAAVIERRRMLETKMLLAVTAALVFIAGIMGYLYHLNEQDYQNYRIDQLAKANEEMAPLVKELKEKEEKLKIIERIRSNRASAMALLDAVSAYPDMGPVTADGRLTLTTFKYSSGQEVVIEGQALAVSDISRFVTYLEGLGGDGQKFFTDVQPRTQAPTELPRRDVTVYSFSIAGTLYDPQARSRER